MIPGEIRQIHCNKRAADIFSHVVVSSKKSTPAPQIFCIFLEEMYSGEPS
jgi:hypothetical protein